MPIPYDPKAIANYFLEKGNGISQMKLHKLIYYAHGWNLAIRKEPLIDEAVEAWDYGPVVRSVYYEFRDKGSAPIDRRATEVRVVRGDGPSLRVRSSTPEVDPDDDETRKLLDRVWDVYGGFTALQLSTMTHKSGDPWADARSANPGVKKPDIQNAAIREHFEARLEKNDTQKSLHA